VVLKTYTLLQMMRNKIEAILERKVIRDGFDIEFLLRRGIELPKLTEKRQLQLKKIMSGSTAYDFKVTPGSVPEPDMRDYYQENQYSYLLEIINQNK